ncbi:disease resistance protein RGA5-like [Miscanthus floridulus]|uniref:disease resistance protein RGA5-like n=1 Tax=Miscanthus floridulus TaxID=154761 RepID=UPI00345866E8
MAEVVAGALPNLLAKLADLIHGEYNLQKEVKSGIKFLMAELESMKGALEKISNTPVHKLDNQDKIWATNVRELSYDIEDSLDIFMVRCKGKKLVKQHGFKEAIDRCLEWLMQPKIRHKIAIKIRDIKSRVEEVAKRRDRYKVISNDAAKPVTVDPRLLAQYYKAIELIGIDEAREEVIKILGEDNEVHRQQFPLKEKVCRQQQDTIVSIVGFGGLGKTTLANAVYEKLRSRFDCSACISVSQTPDMDILLKDMFYQLAKKRNARNQVMNEVREFLNKKRYLIVIDDIWDITVWEMIKCALPDNCYGNKIITTTRILNIAEQAGGAYKLEPLSMNNSRKLLYQRIFGNESKDKNEDNEKCPDELVEVSEKILKKCAGVPLAIITMASLLASKARNKMEWCKVCNSVGTGLENNSALENMRKILAFSYFDLPYHLRTCLLYLSVFPEDYKISKNRLIWMWIAEGFIQSGRQWRCLFDCGESYFNELINRSMIQPIHDTYTGLIKQCRVHDMILDLICSLSSEENFVTILNDVEGTSPSNMTRRLSFQNGKEAHAATLNLQQVRSAVVFPSGIDFVPAIWSFRVLRVLDLHHCTLSQDYSLTYLGNLFHLRYLGLSCTGIVQLPEKIGNLKNLQTLNVMHNQISCLPSSVVQLRNLMCLLVDKWTRMPNGIGNLTCLEELSVLRIDKSSVDIIEELGQLSELRVLHIVLGRWEDKLVECLGKLTKIQNLSIEVPGGDERSIGGLDACWADVAPRHLSALKTRRSCWLSKLPTWMMNPSLVVSLTTVSIAMTELEPVDLKILGRFPALRYLDLEVHQENHKNHDEFAFGAGSFPCLVRGEFCRFAWPVVFRRGAMPRLRELFFSLSYVRMGGETGSSRLGLGKLPSLQRINFDFVSEGVTKEAVKKAKAALCLAAQNHPNRPTLRI